MPVYILKHPSKDYRGFAHGVDFQNGVGSTSDAADKQFLVERFGCKVINGPENGDNGAGVGVPAPAAVLPNDAAFYGSIEAALARVSALPEEMAKKASPVAQEGQAPSPPEKGKPGRKPKAKG